MRKLYVLLMLLCISVSASAQFYAGGTLGVSVVHASSDGASATQSAFAVTPELGYDINPTWAVGITVPVAYSHNDSYNTTKVGILPYVRCTFASASIVDFFGELALGYGHQKTGDYGVGGFDSGLRPGMKINFNDKFALVARTTLLAYSHYDGVNGVGFAINDGFELGFKVSF
ncbi:MAG: porin family protein [Muribaculaceae bacterium]|nr:porin family protein [Muribaculaceae bacterium]